MPQPNQVRPPGKPEGDTKDHAGSEVNESLSTAADIASASAFVVVVVSPYGQPRRRPYLSLHQASLAVQRAHAKGQRAWMVLCQLVPVTAELDGWTS
jgi:hypothetical protein